jgi:hypothetical protein
MIWWDLTTPPPAAIFSTCSWVFEPGCLRFTVIFVPQWFHMRSGFGDTFFNLSYAFLILWPFPPVCSWIAMTFGR